MRINLLLMQPWQLELALAARPEQITLAGWEHSKAGLWPTQDLPQALAACRAAGIKVGLAWDQLVKDQQLEDQGQAILPLCPLLDFLRFLDPGVGLWAQEHCPGLSLQMDLQSSAPNFLAVQAWAEAFAPSLELVVLSNQIPLAAQAALAKQLPVACEVLAAGPLEVFYSRRLLLSPLELGPGSFLQVEAASEDRPQQVNQVLEKPTGTLMYLDRDLCLLDRWAELEASGLAQVGLDLRQESLLSAFAARQKDNNWPNALHQAWPRPVTKGFYKANLTHKPAEYLVNQHLKEVQDQEIGRVLDSQKKQFTLVEFNQGLDLPTQLLLTTPEGRKIGVEMAQAANLKGELCQKRLEAGLYRLDWIKYALPGSRFSILDDK